MVTVVRDALEAAKGAEVDILTAGVLRSNVRIGRILASPSMSDMQ